MTDIEKMKRHWSFDGWPNRSDGTPNGVLVDLKWRKLDLDRLNSLLSDLSELRRDEVLTQPDMIANIWPIPHRLQQFEPVVDYFYKDSLGAYWTVSQKIRIEVHRILGRPG